jgi:hypothetical protein
VIEPVPSMCEALGSIPSVKIIISIIITKNSYCLVMRHCSTGHYSCLQWCWHCRIVYSMHDYIQYRIFGNDNKWLCYLFLYLLFFYHYFWVYTLLNKSCETVRSSLIYIYIYISPVYCTSWLHQNVKWLTFTIWVVSTRYDACTMMKYYG